MLEIHKLHPTIHFTHSKNQLKRLFPHNKSTKNKNDYFRSFSIVAISQNTENFADSFLRHTLEI